MMLVQHGYHEHVLTALRALNEKKEYDVESTVDSSVEPVAPEMSTSKGGPIVLDQCASSLRYRVKEKKGPNYLAYFTRARWQKSLSIVAFEVKASG